MNSPHRSLALVEPLPADPRVRALRLAGARPFVLLHMIQLDKQPVCPFCSVARDSSIERGPRLASGGKVCTGTRRWWRPWGCSLFVEHFHVYCVRCEAKWIMAPADVEL